MNKAVTAEVLVTDGILDLNITSPAATLCLNLCYIKVYLPKDQIVTPTPEPTTVPVVTEAPAPTETPALPEPANSPVSGEENPNLSTEDTDVPTDQSTAANNNTSFPFLAGGVLILAALAGIVAYFFKKKKN